EDCPPPGANADAQATWSILEHATNAQIGSWDMRVRELDETEREALTVVLERIEKAGKTVADEACADVRVEGDDRGRFPSIGFRLQGFSPVKDAPVESSRDA